jgi:hypothetical protein
LLRISFDVYLDVAVGLRKLMERQEVDQINPIAMPLMRAHELVGCSRTNFKKIFVDEGWVKPVDMGARGLSVIVAEVEDAVRKRAAMIRSGEIVPPIRNSTSSRMSARSSRGKRAATAA